MNKHLLLDLYKMYEKEYMICEYKELVMIEEDGMTLVCCHNHVKQFIEISEVIHMDANVDN